MSLLAPLYIAGLLAVALPIIFHLIRRSPQGRQQFSSLMFLSPSPPTITKRSRLTNILLLILRASALALLAFAFARPFFRESQSAPAGARGGKRVAILVDTSASMRRGDLWSQAKRQTEQRIDALSAADQVALFFFDRSVRTAMSFDESDGLESSRRATVAKARLAEAQPGWQSTRLGDALASAADLLARDQTAAKSEFTQRELILISDLQRGGAIEALGRYEWPKEISLVVLPVGSQKSSNASLQLVNDSTTQPTDAKSMRVRVSNEATSSREQFSIAWANDSGPIASLQPIKAYVPPGKSQIVRLPLPTPDEEADRLILSGDDTDFDNTVYVTPPRRQTVRVLYVGDDSADDTKNLRYYAQSAIGDTPARIVAFVATPQVTANDLVDARLVMVTLPPAPDQIAPLRHYIEAGGTVLWVLRDPSAAQSLAALMSLAQLNITEAKASSFALLSRLDFNHPLLAPFADARFSDFSKIRFWHHRHVELGDAASRKVLIGFDTGEPFLIEQTIGKGRLLVMSAGWHPADSQLALSTKFVPLLEGVLTLGATEALKTQYTVGEAPIDGADHPGVYRLTRDGRDTPIAVNLAPEESRTDPLPIEELERWGVRLGAGPEKTARIALQERELKTLELENRQKLWRWVIVIVLGLLAVETAVAARIGKRRDRSASEPLAEVST